MNKSLKALLSLGCAAVLSVSAAAAETISFDGTVTAASTCEVYAPLGGTVEKVSVKAGQTIAAGDEIAVLKTVKVYATEDGTVTAVFGQIGEGAANVTTRYGAVVYVEGDVRFTISASLSNAYSSIETKLVHAGQIVYLRGKNNTDHEGKGVITAVSANDYTVEVLEGDFIVGESVNIHMDETYKDAARVGRGNVARMVPTAYAAEDGTLVSIAVKPGDTVKRGDLLFETLSGTADGVLTSGSAIVAGVDGVVASVNAAQGEALAEDAVVAVIYPADAMQIEGTVDESDLGSVHVGDKAVVTLSWNEDSEVTYVGEVAWIAAIAESSAAESTATSYRVVVTFTPDADTRYGMNATVEIPGAEAGNASAQE